MTPHRNTAQSGFTLLEMVIVLSIVSAILGAFFSFYQPLRNAQRNVVTAQRQDRLMNMLADYALINNRLPCPGAADATGMAFGSAGTACFADNRGYKGIVPFRELGVSPRDVQDGFGHYFTYVMWGNALTERLGTVADQDHGEPIGGGPNDGMKSWFCQVPYPSDAITVYYDGSKLLGYMPDRYFIALIAYGADGKGSYNIEAATPANRLRPIGDGQLDTALGTLERRNAVDQLLVTGGKRVDDATFTDIAGTSHFDDQLLYLDGPGLIARLGTTGCHTIYK